MLGWDRKGDEQGRKRIGHDRIGEGHGKMGWFWTGWDKIWKS